MYDRSYSLHNIAHPQAYIRHSFPTCSAPLEKTRRDDPDRFCRCEGAREPRMRSDPVKGSRIASHRTAPHDAQVASNHSTTEKNKKQKRNTAKPEHYGTGCYATRRRPGAGTPEQPEPNRTPSIHQFQPSYRPFPGKVQKTTRQYARDQS